MAPVVGVVVINWNGRAHLLECLRSLAACEPAADEIVVVDNGSTDGSIEAVHDSFADVMLIANGSNLGFAAANNIGGRAAVDRGCDFVLFLNNDTLVDPPALGLMAETLATPGTAVVNPLIRAFDGSVWFGGARLRRWAGRIEHVHESPADDAPVQLEVATGCALMTTAAVVREFGPFDERFFIYYEDSHLSRTLIRRGDRLMLAPRAVVRHKVSADSLANGQTGFFLYLNTRNRLLFARTNLSTAQWLVSLILFTATYVLPRSAALVALGRVEKARALTRGYADYFRGRFGPPRLR